MKTAIITALLLALVCAPASAADYNRCFGTIDADYDGEMTRAEFTQAFPGGNETVFTAADTDGDTTVSHEEWEAFKASQGFEETHAD